MKRKILTVLSVITVLAAGGVLIASASQDSCTFELHDVNQDNLIEKMVEKIKEQPIDDDVVVGCELKEDGKMLKLSKDGCKKMNKDDYLKYRTDTLDKVQRLDEFSLEEIKQIGKDFEDIWHYHLFKKCGKVKNELLEI